MSKALMDSDRFERLLKQMAEEEQAVFTAKSPDYAERDGSNVLANFQRISERQGVTADLVCLIYLEKHLDAIRTYVRHGSVKSEAIEDRILDARNYLAFLRAMAELKVQH